MRVTAPIRGFTLLELLVAMAIFAGLATVAGSILNRVASTAQRNESRVLVAADFRNAMDRIGTDWAGAVLTRSNAPVFEKLEGNDRLRFFAHVRAPRGAQPEPRLAEVQYAVRPTDPVPAGQAIPETLHRLIQPVEWDDFIGAPDVPPDGEPLAEGIFRQELAFLSDEGTLTIVPPSDPSSIRAVVVAIAALDPVSLRRLDQDQLDSLAGLLPDCQEGHAPMENWDLAAFADLPPYVRENVRFYQRFFPLQ